MPDTDALVEQILRTYDTITVVGASNAADKAAHYVPAHMQEHGWRVIPVNPRGGRIVGEPAYRSLADVPEQVGFVDVFRPAHQAPDIARQAVAAGASALWLQLHIVSDEARSIAEHAGLLYVENRCLIIEQRRLRLDAPGERLAAGRHEANSTSWVASTRSAPATRSSNQSPSTCSAEFTVTPNGVGQPRSACTADRTDTSAVPQACQPAAETITPTARPSR